MLSTAYSVFRLKLRIRKTPHKDTFYAVEFSGTMASIMQKYKDVTCLKFCHFLTPTSDPDTCRCISGGKKCSFSENLTYFVIFVTPALRFFLLPCCERIICVGDNKINCDQNDGHQAALMFLKLVLNMYFMNGSHLILSLRVFR